MHLSKLIDNVDVSFTLENPAVYRLCQDRLKIEKPSYGNLNRMISQVVSSLTVSLRRASEFNVDLNEYQTNLVPFQKRHFMLTSFAPICNEFESPDSYTVDRMTEDAFDPRMQLADCERTKRDKYMACCLIYRGNISTLEANQAVDAVKRKKTIQMVDWCGTGFKVGINRSTPGYIKDSELVKTNR